MSRKLPWLLIATVCGVVMIFSYSRLHAQKTAPVATENGKDADKSSSDLPQASLPRTDGAAIALSSLAGEKGLVVVFVSTECPIANGYVPTLIKLEQDLKAKGVRLVAVNPNAGQSLKAMQAHQKEFGFDFPYLRDAGGAIAKELQVAVCPTACVFDADNKLFYLGQIDDRYVKRGGAAVGVREHTLQLAIDAMLAGKPIANARNKPLGCGVDFAKVSAAKPRSADTITYAGHVAAILEKRCVECHHPGGIGPFSLQTAHDAVRWSEDIVAFTADGAMPPWKMTNEAGLFAHQRSMPKSEIELLAKWVEQGCAAGDLSKLPPPTKFTSTWKLGEPDLVLMPDESYELAADGDDVYRCFVLPTNFDADKFVTAMEVMPGNTAVVHHVIGFIDITDDSTKLDQRDAGPGYATGAGFPGFLPAGGLGGWAPGNTENFLPEGMAKVLPKGAKVVMQVHYHKSGKPERDRTKLGLYFSKVPVNRAVNNIPVASKRGPSGLRIPANEANYEARGALVLPSDQLFLGVTPHMHLLGKDMEVTATLPDGTKRSMFTLRDWDFNWQESYQYEQPIMLPRGTRLDLVAHFDNSAGNRRNPSSPPKLVTWGEGTNDEMCLAFFEATTTTPAKSEKDVHALTGAERLRFMIEARRLAGESTDDQIRDNPFVKGLRDRLGDGELLKAFRGSKK